MTQPGVIGNAPYEVDEGTVDGIGTVEHLKPPVYASNALLLEGAERGTYDLVQVVLTPLTEQVVQLRRFLSTDSLCAGYTPLHQLLGAALRRTSEVWYVTWLSTRASFTQDFQKITFLAAYELDAVNICESVLTSGIMGGVYAPRDVAEYTMLHKTTITHVPAYRAEKLRELIEAVEQFERREAAERRAVEVKQRAAMEQLRQDMSQEQQRMLQEWAQQRRAVQQEQQLARTTAVPGMPQTVEDAMDQYRQWTGSGSRFVADQFIPDNREDAAEAETETGETHE